jgi:tRNA threonylcarbamoyladenosine biosynthesis protein TsaE
MSNILQFESRSPEDTFELGKQIASDAKPGDVYALTGELGAGKTIFTQGFAQGLGYDGNVTSPTFTLMNVYAGGRLTLYHFDTYRFIDAVEGLEGIGYEDFFYAGGVCLVEWAERAEELLPVNAARILIDKADNENKRMITISGRNIAK